ncbi:MAG: LPS assembly protein LptD [Candidatus Omnitrophota bacterium]
MSNLLHQFLGKGCWVACFLFLVSTQAFAQESKTPVEINGDQVEFIVEKNMVIATGNVSILQNDTKLTCDRVEFSRDTNLATAQGHVVLRTPQGSISGDQLVYNFETMTGDFHGATIASHPYYGAGESVSKVAENQIQMKKGYLTTCDLEKPHFKLASKKLDIYPGKKAVARNVTMRFGKVPVMYIPKYSQILNDKPRVTYTPGFDREWGAFLLQSWRYYFSEDFKGIIHLDYRERKDFASGVDLNYNTKNMGGGSIRTYYMNERNITSKYAWQERPSPTIERERFRAQWRHKWSIDNKTEAIWQFYKLSDAGVVKDYLKREYQKDQDPTSYFLLTRNLSNGTFSFRSDVRVNRFTSTVERLPGIRYDVTSQEIGNSGFYLKSENGFDNFSKKDPSPTEVRKETKRFDTNNEISYPMKISFLEFKPFVGGRETYYTKTMNASQYSVMRGIFRTGADLSTRFFRMFDVQGHYWGMDINRLRHVVTPSVAYEYRHDPTIPASSLDYFDDIDAITNDHKIHFSLENKLQTKRKGIAVDLLRVLTSTDFFLKEHSGTGGFGSIASDIEFKPNDWLTFNSDANFDTTKDKLISANFDIYLTGHKWSLDFGKRYALDVDDQITTGFNYVINPKWKFSIYERHDINSGSLKEQEFRVTRDLHCWEMDINFNETRGSGSEIWFVFRLKAFPDLSIDFGNGFNKRKAGSQAGE